MSISDPGSAAIVRVQLGAVRSGHAVRRPDAALLDERAVPGGVVVAGLDDERDGARRGDERGDDGVAAGHAERAARQEVVLDVDRDERGSVGHGRLLSFAGNVGAGSGSRQPRAQREQARRALERRQSGRRDALALGGGVGAVGREVRRLRRAHAVAQHLAQQRLAVARLVGEMQHVRAVRRGA